MFWRRKGKKAEVLEHRVIETEGGLVLEVLKAKTSKPILPAKPGYRFETYQERKPK